jgi:hypothetical protein
VAIIASIEIYLLVKLPASPEQFLVVGNAAHGGCANASLYEKRIVVAQLKWKHKFRRRGCEIQHSKESLRKTNFLVIFFIIPEPASLHEPMVACDGRQ